MNRKAKACLILPTQYYTFYTFFLSFKVHADKYIPNIRINRKVRKIFPQIPMKQDWKSKGGRKIRLYLKAFEVSQAGKQT